MSKKIIQLIDFEWLQKHWSELSCSLLLSFSYSLAPLFFANPLFHFYFLCLLFFLPYSLVFPLFWSTFLSLPSLPFIFLLTLSLFLTKPLFFSPPFFLSYSLALSFLLTLPFSLIFSVSLFFFSLLLSSTPSFLVKLSLSCPLYLLSFFQSSLYF